MILEVANDAIAEPAILHRVLAIAKDCCPPLGGEKGSRNEIHILN